VFRNREREPETNDERKGKDKAIKVKINKLALVQ
jgi:hypothetical protein